MRLNNKGFGIVELAAWLIVIGFLGKLVAVAVVGTSILSADKLRLKEYEKVHLALQR